MATAIETVTTEIYGARENFLAVLSDTSIVFEREAEFAIQLLQGGEFLLKTAMNNRKSLFNAISNIAAIGISLNPAKKQAYLVPRDGKVCLDISYMGLLDLAVESGAIRWGQAKLVHQNDEFALVGIDKEPVHKYSPFDTGRGEVVGAYCVVKVGATDYLTEAMSLDEIHGVRERSTAWKAWLKDKKKCPWVTDPGEMAKKTVVKRAYKYWPRTDRLDRAIHHLNTDGGEGLDLGNGQTLVATPRPPTDVLTEAYSAADKGRVAFAAWWKNATPSQRGALRGDIDALQRRTEQADQKREAVDAKVTRDERAEVGAR